MELAIKDKVYSVKFGIRFVRELDKVFGLERDGIKLGMALTTKLPALYMRDVVALADVLYYGTVTESPRPSLVAIEDYIDGHEDIEQLFEAVLAEIEAGNAGKLLSQKLKEQAEAVS